MSKIAAVQIIFNYNMKRFMISAKDSLARNNLFGDIIGFTDGLTNFEDYIELNTPDTAEDPSSFTNPDLKYDYYRRYLELHIMKTDPLGGIIFIKCPDAAEINWVFLNGVFIDLDEFIRWESDTSGNGLPPRTPEEIQEDKLREIEEKRIQNIKDAEAKRLADLRPQKQGSIALIQIIDSINFNINIITLDLANTKVWQLRAIIAKTLKLSQFGNGIASTNELSISKVKELANQARKSIPMRNYATNMFRSVINGKKVGSGPAVGVATNNRSTLSDSMRLSEIKGNVVVYYYSSIPHVSFSSQFKELAIDALIDIIFD